MPSNRQKLSAIISKLIFVSFSLLFFFTPFVFTWANQELFEFSKMLVVYAFATVIVCLWLGKMVTEKKIIFATSKFDWVLMAFLLSQVISTIFSIHVRTSWFGYYTRFNGGLLSTITYIALYYAFVSNIKKNQLWALFDSLFLSMLLVNLYAIPEHFGHSMSCLLITKKFDVGCWVQDVQNRVFATFGQPNWLAAFLITLIPINIDRLLQEKKLISRLYLLLVLMTSMSSLLFTKSRSGLIGLALGLGFYGMCKIFVLSNAKDRYSNALKLVSVAVLLSFFVLITGTPYTPSLAEMAGKKVTVSQQAEDPMSKIQIGGTPSEDIRKIVWQGALKVWHRYPIFGSGVETFAYSYYLDRPLAHNLVSEWDFLYNKAHNELLNFLANSGLVGLLTYLALFAWIFYIGLRSSWRKSESLIPAVLAGLLAMFISNFFGFSTVVTNLLMFVFFAVVILESETDLTHHKNTAKSSDLSTTEYYIYPIILIASLITLGKIHNIWQADYLFTKGQNTFEKGNYQLGLPLIQQAIAKSPKEALFYDELAGDYAQLSVAFANDGQSTASAKLAQSAIESNRYALALNPVHLNFYKSQARIYLRLGQLDNKLYTYAKQSLEKAISLAPTDAKLYYNLALILEAIGEQDAALSKLEYAVAIKSNYLQARTELARMYIARGELSKAKDQYAYSLEKIAPNDEPIRAKLQAVEASLSGKVVK